jgi:two-component system, cell cycle response regulator DivK
MKPAMRGFYETNGTCEPLPASRFSPNRARRFSPNRVLVIDDHAINRMLLERVLELEHYEVIAADSIAAAEQAIVDAPPALIVLDLQLPDGDGLDLARRLKHSDETRHCPIVACTAGVMKGEERRAIEAGCDAYVSKPLNTRSFADLVGSLLSAAADGVPKRGHLSPV